MRETEYRIPVSVLVVVYSADAEVLLLHRAKPFDFWQSVTGSLRPGEDHADAARRELLEETGLNDEGEWHYSGVSRQFVIDSRWRDRFETGVVENVEFEWHYRLSKSVDIKICDDEHSEFCWLPVAAAVEKVWSWTNRDALRGLNA
ncbi:MAG: dihydroneopterin triphosphate diphosphatase [Woeseiaceae bacterium]